jgi:hypothetical protein
LSPAFDKPFFQTCCTDVKADDNVVFIVCGGAKIGLDEMAEYSGVVKDAANGVSYRRATIDGREYRFV